MNKWQTRNTGIKSAVISIFFLLELGTLKDLEDITFIKQHIIIGEAAKVKQMLAPHYTEKLMHVL